MLLFIFFQCVHVHQRGLHPKVQVCRRAEQPRGVLSHSPVVVWAQNFVKQQLRVEEDEASGHQRVQRGQTHSSRAAGSAQKEQNQ